MPGGQKKNMENQNSNLDKATFSFALFFLFFFFFLKQCEYRKMVESVQVPGKGPINVST